MILYNPAFIIFISFAVSYLLFKAIIPYFHKFLIDRPNERSSHLFCKPTGGGIIFSLTTILFSIFDFFVSEKSFIIFLPLLCIPLIAISFADDIKNVSIRYRFFFQIFTSSIILINFLSKFQNLSIVILIFIFFTLLFCSVGIINFVNFMDGIDGLISGSFLIILITISIQSTFSIGLYALIGSLFGFLIFNWYPAKIFMGDVGSTFLAAIFLGTTFQNNSLMTISSNLLIASPLMIDAITCLIRRKNKNENIFKPHKLHLYQRLHQAGMTHSEVSLIYISGIFLLALASILGDFKIIILFLIVEILIGYLLDKYVAVKFSIN